MLPTPAGGACKEEGQAGDQGHRCRARACPTADGAPRAAWKNSGPLAFTSPHPVRPDNRGLAPGVLPLTGVTPANVQLLVGLAGQLAVGHALDHRKRCARHPDALPRRVQAVLPTRVVKGDEALGLWMAGRGAAGQERCTGHAAGWARGVGCSQTTARSCLPAVSSLQCVPATLRCALDLPPLHLHLTAHLLNVVCRQ